MSDDLISEGRVTKRFKDMGDGAKAEVLWAIEGSLTINAGGNSQKLALTSSSIQSAALDADFVLLSVDVAVFVRQGANPTAFNNGTDQYLPAGIYRVSITRGNKLALILASGTGNAYLTPSA